MITPLSIKAAQSKAKKTKTDVFLSDDTGQRLGWRLLLRCLPSGSATWIFRYTHAGKRYQINFGNLQSLDIPSARRTASSYADIYKDTTDVLGKLQVDAQAKQTAAEASQAKVMLDEKSRQQRDHYTLSNLMILYVAHLTKQGKVTSARDVTSLSKHLTPLANKPAAEISKRDLVTVQRTLLDVGKGRTANKLRSFVRAAYALVLRSESDATAPAAALDFVTIGGVESNPAALLAVAKGFNGTRDRVLTDIELFSLLDHAKDYPGLSGLAVRAAVLLGGQRMAQLLRPSLTDITDGFLVLLDPKGKRDVPRRHPIPLEGMAGVVIAEAVDRANDLKTNWLFSSTGKVRLTPITVSKYIDCVSEEFVRSGISTTLFNMADLRRTIETRLAGLGVSKEVRGYLQSHGLSGVQTRHYNRHDYEQEKRSALRSLHQWIESRGNHHVGGTDVIPLHKVRRKVKVL
jgi:hypothetical protein